MTEIACLSEDGSTPGQEFPCVWHGGPNGEGCVFVLDADGTTHYVTGQRSDHTYTYGTTCIVPARIDAAHHQAELANDAVSPVLLLLPVILLAVVIRRRLHLK